METLIKIKKMTIISLIINIFFMISLICTLSLTIISIIRFKGNGIDSLYFYAIIAMLIIVFLTYISNFVITMIVYRNIIATHFIYEKWYIVSCFLSTFCLGFFTSLINVFLTGSIIKKLKVKEGEIRNCYKNNNNQ